MSRNIFRDPWQWLLLAGRTRIAGYYIVANVILRQRQHEDLASIEKQIPAAEIAGLPLTLW